MIAKVLRWLRSILLRRITLEYLWLDGADPASIRSITYVHNHGPFARVSTLPTKTFAGFSTNQASEEQSDCLLVPVRIYPNPFLQGAKLVLAEVYTPDGQPHPSNHRHSLLVRVAATQSHKPYFGIEQEYYLTRDPAQDISKSDANYCGVGTESVFNRSLVAHHFEKCLATKLHISGYNAEATRGQWEFQIGPVDPLTVADDLIVARYILLRLAESDGLHVSFKPVPTDTSFNMSGTHVNFSDKQTRRANSLGTLEQKIRKLGASHLETIAILGAENEARLRTNNTAYQTFKFGRLDRSAAIRIPLATVQKQSGHFEDRRPGANIDPYRYFHFFLTKLYDL